MASAYSGFENDITQEDLDNFYQGMGSAALIPQDYYSIEDISTPIEIDHRLQKELTLDNIAGNAGINDRDKLTAADEDSEELDLQYQLQLYSEGKIGDLSKLLEENKVDDLSSTSKKTQSTKNKKQNSSINRTNDTSKVKDKIQNKNNKESNNNESNNNKPHYRDNETINKSFIKPPPPPKKSQQQTKQSANKQVRVNKDVEKYLTYTGEDTGGGKTTKFNIGLSNDQISSSNNSNSNNNRSDSNSITTPKLNEMHQIMKSWLEIDDEIKEINKIAKTLREKKKELTENLLKDMTDFKVGYLSEGTQQLKYAVSYSKQGYKRDFIMEKLTDYLKDAKMAEQIANYLEESREKTEKVDIRRGKTKLPKKSK